MEVNEDGGMHMSRLIEIIENHNKLDDLIAIIKHHGVNAQFIADALLQTFEKDPTEEDSDEANYKLLVEDIKQYQAQF